MVMMVILEACQQIMRMLTIMISNRNAFQKLIITRTIKNIYNAAITNYFSNNNTDINMTMKILQHFFESQIILTYIVDWNT